MAHNTILPARQEYYLGLDIGTDSVGYAVTNLEYDLLKFKGTPAWGVNLFDSANLNTKRRAYRTARRRLDRRQQRVSLVQELFAAEIAKVDPRFYTRLQKSALYRDQAEAPFTLFNDPDYTDHEYHRTILKNTNTIEQRLRSLSDKFSKMLNVDSIFACVPALISMTSDYVHKTASIHFAF